MTQRSGSIRSRRAAGRARWHRWADRRRAGRATCPIGRAVTDLIAHGDLPRKIT